MYFIVHCKTKNSNIITIKFFICFFSDVVTLTSETAKIKLSRYVFENTDYLGPGFETSINTCMSLHYFA